MTANISFAQITTMGVGGYIADFREPMTRVDVIECVEEADSKHIPLCIVGGGSNILASSAEFNGMVVRDARRLISVLDEAAPVRDEHDRTVHVQAEAGCNFDDFVAQTVELNLEGLEGLSGIPGTVGASVVQNIGAYGQEVATSVTSVEVWDRQTKQSYELKHDDLQFGYRDSLLKRSMFAGPGQPAAPFHPSPRYVVLSVTFALKHSTDGTVGHAQLARALNVEQGSRMPIAAIRSAVLKVRGMKCMLEDAMRYRDPAMEATKKPANVELAVQMQQRQMQELLSADEVMADAEATAVGQSLLLDRHSCGSFFTNPIVTPEESKRLPADAPQFRGELSDGSEGVKTSAAWLIDHAGFHKGYAVSDDARASLSTRHTLALTNRGAATSDDLITLARTVRDGVREQFGITLVPEPVFVGCTLD
ncbi:UDP-N-acetylenolpyruvoylglucosamine reductase [Bifidobacterium dolichotidis]|uniref:UDP-N-acetylenolpyruvoylglucosamine reductase n=1 Tax=Bifidobacterium dolichotidis TaxID=2306976 RepID=A0A430FQ83_9BIFI|nr:FAD-binding protein [Bifidobacterium dolichotidis]RSX54999.1 UDP-N-acetylenolpyruvoylglucosamine reductase [Bifidobacterium dolichotidis]